MDSAIRFLRFDPGSERCVTASRLHASAPRRAARASEHAPPRIAMARRAAFATLALGLAALAAPPAAAGQFTTTCTCSGSGLFTLVTITPDGTFDDWDTVVTNSGVPANGNPRNNVCDADGSDNTETGTHPDRDWQVQSTGRDLEQFAFTWDDTNLYFYTRRYASTNNIQRFIYYGDIDGDGKMEGDGNAGSEIAIHIDWQGNNQAVSVNRYYYLEANAGGDDMVDGSGFADGYDLPGGLRNGSALRDGDWGSSDGLQSEFLVTWAELGLAGPTPVVFHVSALNSAINNSIPPNQIDDNAGGCGGGAGSFQFADLTFTPDVTLTATHDTGQPAHPYSEQHCAAHTLTNDGNDDDIFDLTRSALPAFVSAFTLYADNDASGTLTGGDTALTDVTEPDAYTNITDVGTTVDTGVLATTASKDLLACYTLDFTTSYTPAAGNSTVTLTATSVYDSGTSATVTDTLTVVTVVDLDFTKLSLAVSDPVNGATNPKRIPGGFVRYQLTATNYGGRALDPASFVLTDLIPAATDLMVTDIGGTPAGPVSQTDGAVACGLATSFVALGDATDSLSFSDDGGASYAFLGAAPNAFNVDPAVDGLRILPTGTFVGQSAATAPSCTWTYRVRVE